MSDKARHYRNDAIDITYDFSRCIHAEECVRGLASVFDAARRPWILPGGASIEAVAAVIAKCPSGALHFSRLDFGRPEEPSEPATIVPTPGGPLYVRGPIQLRSADGERVLEESRLALCRCGASGNKPFCDNSHRDVGFDDPGNLGPGQSENGENQSH